MRPTTPRERKLVAIGVLVALIALVQLAIVAPVVRGFADRAARRETLELAYLHNARTIANIPRARRLAEAQQAVFARFALEAADPVAATQALRERIERIVVATGGEFQAGEDADAPPGWVAVRASAHVTLDQLAATLERLQDEPPWLVVEALDIAADQALVNGRLNPMEVSFDVAIPTRPAKPR